MLVLSRKTNETVIFGEGEHRVVITVTEVRNGVVRLGIEADRSVDVLRGELAATPGSGKPR